MPADRMTAAEYRALAAGADRGGSKYRSKRTLGPDLCDGARLYDSRKGAALAARLDGERRAGGIVTAIPEVSVPIGEVGGKPVRHRLDFLAILEVRPDGCFVGRWIEAKGLDAQVGRRKRLAFTRLYGMPVELF